MQVLQDEDCRLFPAEPLEEVDQDLEEPSPAQLAEERLRDRLAELGQQPGEIVAACAEELVNPLRREIADQRSQRGDERCEGQAVPAELDTTADQHPRPLGSRAGDELIDQPGLAHPCFAADNQHGGLPGGSLAEHRVEGVELTPATYEHRAEGSACHICEHATGV